MWSETMIWPYVGLRGSNHNLDSTVAIYNPPLFVVSTLHFSHAIGVRATQLKVLPNPVLAHKGIMYRGRWAPLGQAGGLFHAWCRAWPSQVGGRDGTRDGTGCTHTHPPMKVADALADLQYVLAGAVLEFGMGDRFASIFNEVQRSNMSKACTTVEEVWLGECAHIRAGCQNVLARGLVLGEASPGTFGEGICTQHTH